jgi:hypothetical protein
VVGTVELPGLKSFLEGAGIAATAVPAGADLRRYSVLAVTPEALTGGFPARLAAWVRGGGGLMIASTGWGWSQITGRPITEHPGSQFTAAAGLIWNSSLLSGDNGTVAVTPQISRAFHAGFALADLQAPRAGRGREAKQAMSAGRGRETKQAMSSCLLAVGSLPASETAFRQQLRQVAGRTSPVPTAAKPIRAADARAALALAVAVTEAKQAPAEQVRALAAAADFPGSTPAGAPRVSRKVSVNAAAPGWASTGLYVPAGSVVTVSLPFPALKGSWSLRVGAHSDELWSLDAWQRAPDITRVFPVSQRATRIASGFGGLLYVQVPEDAGTGNVEAQVEGVVEAPLFQLGKTRLQEWRREVRNRPGPWAELAGRRVIFTVPSSAIRNLQDPQSLLELWDRLVESQEKLVARAPRRTPERIVADRQISAGYMHSGYPIMTPIDESMHQALNEAKLRAEGTWGHLHELGHNLQDEAWTFDGAGEVTNNVLVLYNFEKVLGLPFASGHPEIKDKAQRTARINKYRADGAKFETWKDDPFLALMMYIELIEGFGWAPLERVFAEYRALSASDLPTTDEARRDQWMIRVSRAVNRNLGPFFQRWGVPVSNRARQQVSRLQAWPGP